MAKVYVEVDRSGFTAEPQGARLTQAERELQFTRIAQTITAPTSTTTRLQFTPYDIRHAQKTHLAIQQRQFMLATV